MNCHVYPGYRVHLGKETKRPSRPTVVYSQNMHNKTKWCKLNVEIWMAEYNSDVSYQAHQYTRSSFLSSQPNCCAYTPFGWRCNSNPNASPLRTVWLFINKSFLCWKKLKDDPIYSLYYSGGHVRRSSPRRDVIANVSWERPHYRSSLACRRCLLPNKEMIY